VANVPVENAIGFQQINFQVPFEAKSNVVEVRYQGLSTFAMPPAVAPGIFTLGDGSGAVQHASDYSFVTPSNPAEKGEVIIIYTTGLGRVRPAVPSGTGATGPVPIQPECRLPYTNLSLDVLYAGLTPGFVGLYQVNIRLPESIPSGNLDLYITYGCFLDAQPWNRIHSNTVKLPVR
jgi:uncharacterized protein (TIGR03437 family)